MRRRRLVIARASLCIRFRIPQGVPSPASLEGLMASRQEEKEARRRARLEQEAAERKAESRRKRLQMVLGGILAVGIIAGIAIAVLAGGGGDSKADPPTPASTTGVKLPPPGTGGPAPPLQAAGRPP